MISETEIHNAKILIVDDQESNVLLLQRVLEVASYTSVSFTTDPYKVYELHRQNHYDLILLDLKMAGMDGFQVLEALKEIEAEGYLSYWLLPRIRIASFAPPIRRKILSANRLTWPRCWRACTICWKSAYCISRPAASKNPGIYGTARPAHGACEPAPSGRKSLAGDYSRKKER